MRLALIFAALFLASSAHADVVDQFGGFDLWDTCEAFPELIRPEKATSGGNAVYALSLGIDDSVTHKECGVSAAALRRFFDPATAQFFATDTETGADFGPSLLSEPLFLEPPKRQDCPSGDDDEQRYQRNELRFTKASGGIAKWAEPTWYSITFRMSGTIYPCGSARWVIGQWKQYTREEDGDRGPVLAQRFDNGILHVSVQSEDCRCVIAKASGDFNAVVAGTALLATASPRSLRPSDPIECLDARRKTERTACSPEHFTMWTEGGNPPPELPDPKARFITMTYYVQAGNDGRIDVYANGKFVVRVTGQIGYSQVGSEFFKFKVGQYRANIPGSATMSIDRVCVSKDVSVCDPSVRPLPAPL